MFQKRTALLFSLLLSGLLVGGGVEATTRGLKIVKVHDQQGVQVSSYKQSIALLIGVSEYKDPAWPDLESIPMELNNVAKTLEGQGFTVKKHLNPSGKQLENLFDDFIDEYGFDPDNRLLFFFAGHGYTRENAHKGYIVPADASNPRTNLRGFLRRAMPMSDIVALAKKSESKHALFLFDSCFSGTIFKERALPEKPPYISKMTARPVRQFITAGSAGESVPAKSTFTRIFVDALKQGRGDLNRDGYISGTELGFYLQSEVPKYESQQTPQFGKIKDYDLSQGDFVFVLPEARQQLASIRRNDPKEPTGEHLFWNEVKSTNKADLIKLYIAKYPKGLFVDIAKYKIGELEKNTAIREEPEKAERASLTVRSNVWNDKVYIDGVLKGSTRVDLELPKGKHSIRVEKSGYTTYKQSINLEAATVVTARLIKLKDTSKTPKEISHLVESAKQNNAEALYQLGWRYQNGIGVVANKEKAEQFFQKAAAEKKKREAERKRQEQPQLAKQREEKIKREASQALSQHSRLIGNKVSQNWIEPPTYRTGQTVLIKVKVSARGEVLSAVIVRGSGDENFDRSVVAAINKATPLPIPLDPRFFEYINEFNFLFNPDST